MGLIALLEHDTAFNAVIYAVRGHSHSMSTVTSTGEECKGRTESGP